MDKYKDFYTTNINARKAAFMVKTGPQAKSEKRGHVTRTCPLFSSVFNKLPKCGKY